MRLTHHSGSEARHTSVPYHCRISRTVISRRGGSLITAAWPVMATVRALPSSLYIQSRGMPKRAATSRLSTSAKAVRTQPSPSRASSSRARVVLPHPALAERPMIRRFMMPPYAALAACSAPSGLNPSGRL